MSAAASTVWKDPITSMIRGTSKNKAANLYGLKIPDMTVGTASNYAIYTGLGAVHFGDVVTAPQYKLSALNTAPASATATGTLGEIRVTSDYIYVCSALNTWVRSALTTW